MSNRIVEAARAATLPEGFQWGGDALEAFNFGKERAALAVEQPALELELEGLRQMEGWIKARATLDGFRADAVRALEAEGQFIAADLVRRL